MRVAVAFAVVQVFHQTGGRIAQVHGHRACTVFFDKGLGGIEGFVHGVGLGRDGQVNHAFGQGQFALGCAQALVDIGGIQSHAQRAWVGQANVFTGHADQAARHVAGLGTAIEHAHEPIQCSVGV